MSTHDQCWKDMAYPDRRCTMAGTWKSPASSCTGQFCVFMSAVRWCDVHRHADDVPVEQQIEKDAGI